MRAQSIQRPLCGRQHSMSSNNNNIFVIDGIVPGDRESGHAMERNCAMFKYKQTTNVLLQDLTPNVLAFFSTNRQLLLSHFLYNQRETLGRDYASQLNLNLI